MRLFTKSIYNLRWIFFGVALLTLFVILPAKAHAEGSSVFSGRLTNASSSAIPNAIVQLYTATGSLAGSSTTDSSGNFSIAVAPAKYRLTINGSLAPSNGFILNQSGTGIDLTNGNVVQNLQVNTTNITFTVYNNAGAPKTSGGVYSSASGGSTSLYPGDIGETITAANGTASISGTTGTIVSIVGATYNANGLNSASNSGSICEYLATSVYNCITTPLTVTGPTSITVSLASEYHTFSGNLIDSGGGPIANSQITLNRYSDSSTKATTDANGHFSITAAPGRYSISINGSFGVGNAFIMNQSSAAIDLTTGNVTQDLRINTARISYTVYDSAGLPKTSATVYATSSGSSSTSLYPGDVGETVTYIGYQGGYSSGTTGTFVSIVGATYNANGLNATSSNGSICERLTTSVYNCITAPLTVSGPVSISIPQTPAPSIPTGFVAPSPTQHPILTWNSVSTATSYNVYRNGLLVGSATGTTYTDNSAPVGAFSYYVTAVNLTGESGPSSTASVTVIPPTYTFSGKLTDQNNNALANVYIVILDAYGNGASNRTDSSGNFSLAVQPGMYYISDIHGSGTVDNLGNFSMSQDATNPSIDLTSGNVSQNLMLNVATVKVTTYNLQGYPTGSYVSAVTPNSATKPVSLYPGDPGFHASQNSSSSSNYSVCSGGLCTSTLGTIVGLTFSGTGYSNGICETLSGVYYCNQSPLTIVDGVNDLVLPQTSAVVPAAPTGLHAVSPTLSPSLDWDSVTNAIYYRVVRNGIVIALTSATSFNDFNIASGTYSYYVVAVSNSGGVSSPSNTISVMVALEPPTTSLAAATPTYITYGESTTLTAQITGNSNGVIGGEYYIGSVNPGAGNGTPMTYSNGILTAVITNLAPGSYVLNVRAQNIVGWGEVASTQVYVRTLAPTNLYADTPTHLPILTWDSVNYAVGYNIYRNGNKIGISTTNSYTDTTAPIATNTYYVTALNPDNLQSLSSNSINITYAGPLYTVSGQVSFNATPAGGVLIDNNKSDGYSDYGVTNGTGTYNLYNLENGNYSVTVSNPTGASVSANYAPNLFTITSGSPFVTVNGADATQNLAFNTSAVTITVKDGQGRIIPNAYVTLNNVYGGLLTMADGSQVFNLSDGNLTDFGYTAPDGTLIMYVFPGMTYKICASFPAPNASSVNGPYCMPVNVMVAADMSVQVDLPYVYSVEGNIGFGGNSVSQGQAEVVFTSSDGTIKEVAYSDQNGNYHVDYLPSGSYDLQLYSVTGGAAGSMPQYWDLLESSAITVNDSDITQNFSFDTNTVQVSIIDGSGAVVPNGSVYIVTRSNNPITTTDGAFTFTPNTDKRVAYGNTSTGNILLSVFSNESYEVCAQVSTGTYCIPSNVQVYSDMSLVVVAAQTYTANGVITANGSPLSMATVSLSNGIYSQSYATGVNGVYTINNLIDGNYTTSINYNNSSDSTLPDSFTFSSATPYLTVNGGNVTAPSLDFSTAPVVVNVYGLNGEPVLGSYVLATNLSSTVSTSDGSQTFNAGLVRAYGYSNLDHSTIYYLIPGVTYNICAVVDNAQYCALATVTADTTTTVDIKAMAPSGLTAPHVTPYPQNPVLSWNAVTDAVFYNVYRDGSAEPIGSSATASFTDSSAVEGPHTYSITAIYANSVETAHSNVISVIVDKTAPVAQSISWANNPSMFGATTAVVTAHISDNLTDIVASEYYIGDTDPGIGYGTAMNALSANFGGEDFPPGTYVINIRGKDAAGIWSDVVTTTLVVNLLPPQNLYISSTMYEPPVVNWSAVHGAEYYTVYRNGVDIGSSNTTSYTDTGASAGINTYDVVAISLLGIQSAHSDSVSTTYDPYPPTINYTVDPEPINGWNNSPVTVSFTCEATYGLASCPNPVTVSQQGVNQQITVTATDDLGGSTTITVTVNIDKTAPEISYGLSSTPNASSWFGSDVTVTFNCSDALSGVASCSDPVTLVNDGTNQTVVGTVVDAAGNTTSTSVVVNIDKTAPTISYALSQTPNVNGWNNGDVTVTFICSDALSGIATCNAPITLTTDGANQEVTGTVTDVAGNTSTVTATVNIDKTLPTIGYTLNPVPNSNGWNNSDLVVTFTCNDTISGIAFCDSPITVANEGSNQAITGIATDNAGNSSTVTVVTNIDKTAPAISYTVSPSPNSSGWNNTSSVTVTFSCSDSGSGISSCTDPVTISSGDGAYTVTGIATDIAGNTTTVNVTVNIDSIAPAIGSPTWSANPSPLGSNTTLTALASDSGSGAIGGEYFIDTDPGAGNGTTMVWNGTDLTATFGANLATGYYTIGMRALDAAGNWSNITYAYLVVYNPSGPTEISGHKNFTPSLAEGDILPGLISSTQKDKATMSFDVSYGANGSISSVSNFSFTYNTGNACNSPNPSDCYSTNLISISFSGLIFSGTNNSQATYEGTGTLTINGVVETIMFKVEAVDGRLLGSGASDSFAMQIYAPGVNPNDSGATPIYQVATTITGNGIVII